MKKLLIIVGVVVIAAVMALGAVFGIPRIIKSNQEKDYSEMVANSDYAGAAQITADMLEKEPESYELKKRLASSYYLSEQYDKAEVLYKDLVDKEPENTEFLTDFYKILIETGKDSDAVTVIEKLKKITGNISYYKMLADMYEESGDINSAMDNVIYLISNEPDKAALYYRAASYSKSLNDAAALEEYLLSAVEKDPQNEIYAKEYAEAVFTAERIDDAIDFLAETKVREGSEILSTMFIDYTRVYVDSILKEENYVKAITYLKNAPARENGNSLNDLYKELTKPPVNPVYSVDGGIYSLNETITLELSQPERNVQIYYTLDGSEPDTSSNLYTGVIAVLEPGDSIVTVKAVAFNEKGIYSSILSETYEYPVEFKDAALGSIIADYFNTSVDRLTYDMIDKVTTIQVWGSLTGINVEFRDVIQYYGSDGGSFNLNGQFNNTRGNIKSLEDISKFRNLTELSVNSCSISSLPDFSNLKNLTYVRLMDDSLRDISKLSTLVNVRELYICGNGITDISAIKDLGSLTVVWAGRNNIRSLGDLSGMFSINDLLLMHNNISDISGLAELNSLRKLSLGSNNISDTGPLAGLITLTDLNIMSNNITDLAPLSGLIGLRELYISNNNITDISALTRMKALIFLNASGCRISDISPMLELTALQSLYFRDNKVSYDTGILDQLTWVREKVVAR